MSVGMPPSRRPKGLPANQRADAKKPLPSSSRPGVSSDRWYARKLRRRIFAALVCAFLSVIVTRVALSTARGQGVDTIFMEAAAKSARRFDPLVQLVTSLVSVPAIVFVGTLVFLVALARRRPTLAGRAIVMVLGANATTQIAKALLDRPDLGLSTALPNSLPSGHTTVAMSITLALVMVAPQWLRAPSAWAGWIWASLMGISVMISAWHRLADVLVAFFICGAWALALAPIEGRERHAPAMQRAMSIGVLAFLIVAVLLTIFALAGISLKEISSPGAYSFGYDAYLESAPWRSRVLALAASTWVLSVAGWVINEVDVLCSRRD
ncbi:phosphatase PAP2 family protein [Schaalia cardiffensis]|nr:phosphatase PAP2 family protein [Schaalia cardiffensis]